jgi:hypothetical protein
MKKGNKGKYVKQTRNLMKWEKFQADESYRKGVAVGLILGALTVAILVIVLIGILS